MNARIPLLSAALALQLVVIGLVFLLGGREQQDALFLDFDPAAVTGVTVAGGGEEAPIELSRSGDGWAFADGVKADASKIDAVLEKLAGASGAWPVATSGTSQERFEVTAEKHQRHLTIEGADGVLAEVYLGTSPGYRRVHARRADAEAVFSIDFANHEVPTTRGDWLDKTLLQPKEVSRIALEGGWTLEKTEAGWQLDAGPADAEAVQRLVDRIQGLRVTGFHEGEGAALEAPRSLSVEDAAGALTLTLSHDTADDEYVVESDRVDGRFTLPSYVAEQILVEADDFAPAPSAETAETPAAASPAATASPEAAEAP